MPRLAIDGIDIAVWHEIDIFMETALIDGTVGRW
jgi:hypothetical protein